MSGPGFITPPSAVPTCPAWEVRRGKSPGRNLGSTYAKTSNWEFGRPDFQLGPVTQLELPKTKLSDSQAVYCRVVEVEAWETAVPQPVVWTNAVRVRSSGNSLTKTATTGWGNAGASSTQTLVSGDGYVEATVAEVGRSRMFGFSHADTNQSWDTIDFGLHCANDGNKTIYVYESGTQRGTFGSYASGDGYLNRYSSSAQGVSRDIDLFWLTPMAFRNRFRPPHFHPGFSILPDIRSHLTE